MCYIAGNEKFQQGLSFIHIPKTAGNSLEKLIYRLYRGLFHIGHTTINEIYTHTVQTNQWPSNYDTLIKNSYKISIVRNPYDRVRSYYSYLRMQKLIDMDQTFTDFLSSIVDKSNNERAVWTQTSFLYHQDRLQIDKIIKYENLQKGIYDVFNTSLDIHTHNSGSESIPITAENKEIIKKLYKEDFINFNYVY